MKIDYTATASTTFTFPQERMFKIGEGKAKTIRNLTELMEYARRIRIWHIGVGQMKLAKEFGCSATHVSNAELHGDDVSLDYWFKFAKKLGLELNAPTFKSLEDRKENQKKMSMDTLEMQQSILKVLALELYGDFEQAYKANEPYGVRYKRLEEETGIPHLHLRPEVIELRNLGYIELMPTIDMEDGGPSGSGYFLTSKGEDFVEGMFNIKFD